MTKAKKELPAHRDLKANPAVAASVVVDVDLHVLWRRALDPAELDVDTAAAWAGVGDLQRSACIKIHPSVIWVRAKCTVMAIQ